MAWLDRIPWSLALLAALTFGLSPFVPEPHVWAKLKLLGQGALVRLADVVDLVLHAVPWAVLGAKMMRQIRRGNAL
jgi:hypothetical protein